MTDNPVIQAMRTRRSVRRYRSGEVTRETLETIPDCGRLAPSSNNRQSWEFVVLTRPETLSQLAEICTFGRFIRDAAACIVVCGDLTHNRSLFIDGAAATENMLLAIHALGLASCWVQGYDKPYNAQIKQLLAIPHGLELVSLVPVAHPAGPSTMPRKRELADVVHWERY